MPTKNRDIARETSIPNSLLQPRAVGAVTDNRDSGGGLLGEQLLSRFDQEPLTFFDVEPGDANEVDMIPRRPRRRLLDEHWLYAAPDDIQLGPSAWRSKDMALAAAEITDAGREGGPSQLLAESKLPRTVEHIGPVDSKAERNPAQLGGQHGNRRRVFANVVVKNLRSAGQQPRGQIVGFDEIRGLPERTADAIRGGREPRENGTRHQPELPFARAGEEPRPSLPPGGRVQVEADISIRDGQEWVSITVTDSGPGIDSDLLSRLFEPFASTRLDAHGTGLGLAVTEGIVKEHGGLILARNRTDRPGAVFEIMLPMHAAPGESGELFSREPARATEK